MGSEILWMVPGGKMQEFHSMGDVNRDGVIDENDVALVQSAWQSTPQSANWNPDCDLNGDGKVDSKEVAILSRNYGKDVFTWMGWPEQGVIEWGIVGGVLATIATIGGAAYYFLTHPELMHPGVPIYTM